jgi:hypothetical protein
MVSAQCSNGFIKPPPPFLTFTRVYVSKERLYWLFIKKKFAYLCLCNQSPYSNPCGKLVGTLQNAHLSYMENLTEILLQKETFL